MKSFTDYLNEKMDPRKHAVERDGKFVVVDKDGETVKTFDDKEAAEKYAVANHDKLMEGCGCDGTNEDVSSKDAGRIGAAISNRKDLPASEKNVARRSLQRKVARAKRREKAFNVNADSGSRYRVGTKRPTSDTDPKHKGLRRNNVIAKTLKSYGTNEDVEQVDELKKSTLMSYKDKAKKSERSGRDTGFEGETPSEREAGVQQVKKRRKGIDGATKRLVARQYEDVEQIDELSPKTLKSYIWKAKGKVQSDLNTGKHSPETNKRAKNVVKAKRRVGEDVEQVDELDTKTMKSYIKKAQKDNTDRVTRMADKPSHMPADKGEMRKLRKRQRGIVKAKTEVSMRKIAGDDYRSRMGEEVESVDEMKYLGKDKKFGRKFYEKDGQLHVVVNDGRPQNLGSVEVKGNARMIKKLVKEESIDEAVFSKSQLDQIRAQYSKIKSVDPSQPTYGKLTAFLDKLDDAKLKQLSTAKIKFVSGLALNRVTKRKMK